MRGASRAGAGAFLLALLFGLLYLAPYLLPGRTLLPQDPRTFEPWRAGLPPGLARALDREAVPHRLDKLLQFLPFDRVVGESWARGEPPLWEPRLLCGLPLAAQGTSRPFYPTALFFGLFPPELCYAWLYLAHLAFGGWAMFRLARALKVSTSGALLADLAFVGSGWALAHIHHPMIFMASVWALPAFEAVVRIFDEEPGRAWSGRRTTAVLALSLALACFAGFLQAGLLAILLVGASALVLGLGGWRNGGGLPWRTWGWIGAGIALGLALAAPQILPSLEMAARSAREEGGKALLTSKALAWPHLLEYLWPSLMSAPGDICPLPGEPRPTFAALLLTPASRLPALAEGVWNHTETAVHFGLWPFLLALAALPGLLPGNPRRLQTGLLAGLALFALATAMALPLVLDLALLFPGTARGDLKRWTMLPALCLPVLSGLGYDRWERRARGRPGPALAKGLRRPLLGLALLLSAVGTWLLLAVGAEDFGKGFAKLLELRYGREAGQAFLTKLAPGEAGLNLDLLGRSLLLAGLALALPLLAPFRRLLPLLLLATAVERLPVAWSLSPAPAAASLDLRLPLLPGESAARRPPDRILRLDTRAEVRGRGRLRLLPPNLPLAMGLGDLQGYAPIPPRAAEIFFGMLDPGAPARGAGVAAFRDPKILRSPLLDLCAPAYLWTDLEEAGPGWKLLGRAGTVSLFERRPRAPYLRVYGKARLLPAARIPDALRRIDPRAELLLASFEGEAPGAPPGNADPHPFSRPPARVGLLRWKAGAMGIRFEAERPCWLFLAEAWAPGWFYRIDEGPWKPTRPAQILFQALPLPKGKGRIELRYRPASFRRGLLLALAGLTLLLALFPLRPRGRAAAPPT